MAETLPPLPVEVHLAILQAAPDAIVVTDPSGTIVYANDSVATVFGHAPGSILGQPIEVLIPRALRSRHADVRRTYEARPTRRSMGARLEIVGLRADGSEVPLDISLSPVSTSAGRYIVSVARDVTERRAMEQQLRELSFRDALTGLYSRTYFAIEVERLEASRLYPVTCFVCDVDYLKDVNDNQGHAAGDELLKRAANLVRGCFRAEDVVARIGGDEFAAIVPSMDEELAEAASRRLRDALEAARVASTSGAPPLSISFGSATVREAPLQRAIERADAAMYTAKRGSPSRKSRPR